MAKAGIFFWNCNHQPKACLPAGRAGAKFSPKLQFGDWKNERKARLIHARSKKNESCM